METTFVLNGEAKPKKIKPEKYIRPPKESKVEYSDCEPITQDEAWFRHHNWKEKRELVHKCLIESCASASQLFNFQNCGAEALIEWSEELQKHRVRAAYCHNRHCEPCMRAKANLLAANLRTRLAQKANGRYRFITLTLRHRRTGLKEQIKRLTTCYAKLRSQRGWKETQRGGAAILEVKYKPETKCWHPHLHIIAEGDFLKNSELSRMWLKVTGDSQIVDIRQLTGEKDAAHYVAKYMSKGTNNEVWQNTAVAVEWIKAMKGVRMCATFGTWRGYKLLERADDAKDWKPVGLLRSVANAARRGELASILLIMALEESIMYNPHRPRGKKPPAD